MCSYKLKTAAPNQPKLPEANTDTKTCDSLNQTGNLANPTDPDEIM